MAVATLEDQVFDPTGRSFTLRGPGRSGGEGTVYEIEGRPTQLAKIYHRAKLNAELTEKLHAMRASPPRDPAWESQRHRSIAWVQELLYSDPARRAVVGFVMPRIDTARFKEAHIYFDPDDRIQRFGGGFTWKHLLGTAMNIASTVAAVHAQGHRIGDLRETNVLVSPEALVALIDCDSFQIRDAGSDRIFYPRVGTADYLPPELHGADFRNDHDRSYADRFALGVLLFKMLMQGTHPYQARGARVAGLATTEAKIARGLYPYPHRRGVEPPSYAPAYEILPPRARALFERCFVAGHKRPHHRPTADEWFEVLKRESKNLRACAANTNHVYCAHLRRCPWCRMQQDPFPSPLAARPQRRVAVATPRPVTRPQPRSSPAPTPVPAQRISRRPSRMPTIVVGSLLAFGALVASPLGHGASPVATHTTAFSARAAGSCPYERSTGPSGGCVARWRFGPAATITHRSRRWFFFAHETRLLRIDFAVRFDGAARVPWIDSLSFNARGAPVCLAPCNDRIEIVSSAGTDPLVASGGIAAQSADLLGSREYEGSWTFDVSRARGTLYLRYPGLAPLALGSAA